MIIKKILDFFNKGHQRTVTIKKNIIGTFVLKAYTVLISFLLVPLSISCLDAQRYGLWLTINSIIGWFAIFDIGLGHGLRNKFAENKAKGKIKIIKVYTSTAYFSITIICFLLFLMFMVVNNFLNWQKILNTSLISKEELNT